MSNKKSSTSFLVQGSILAMASIISRIIGLVYRIPLTAIIGNKGNDYYGCAFEIYNILLIISSYSLPLAVSKLVSADMSLGRKKNVYRILKCALIFGLVSGTIAALILFFGAEFITGTIMKTPYSIFAVKVLVPTLIVVAVLGVMRGFFQGLGTMMPSAVSQILEQIANAIVSVWAAYVLYNYGTKVGAVLGNAENYAAAYGAAGGTLGTGTGAVVGLLFAAFVLLAYLSVFKRQMKRERRAKVDSYSYIFKILFITIIPVLMSTTIYNCNAILDQAIFKNIANLQGYSANDISEWNGIYTGKYKTLINVPISIARNSPISGQPPKSWMRLTQMVRKRQSAHRSTQQSVLSWWLRSLVQWEWVFLHLRFYSFCSVIPRNLQRVCCSLVLFLLYFSRCRRSQMVCYRELTVCGNL